MTSEKTKTKQDESFLCVNNDKVLDFPTDEFNIKPGAFCVSVFDGDKAVGVFVAVGMRTVENSTT